MVKVLYQSEYRYFQLNSELARTNVFPKYHFGTQSAEMRELVINLRIFLNKCWKVPDSFSEDILAELMEHTEVKLGIFFFSFG